MTRNGQELSVMLVSRILRLPPRTLYVRLYASKAASVALKAVPEQVTSGAPPAGGEWNAFGQLSRNASLLTRARSHAVFMPPKYHPRRIKLPQRPAPRAFPSRRGVSALVMEAIGQV